MTLLQEKQVQGTTRELYRQTILAMAHLDQRLLCLDSDMGGLEDTFAQALPKQYIHVGIAEANMMGIAAGLAAMGKIPFVNTMASFAAMRACEQVKVDIADNNLPVKIVASHGGLSAGHFGPTHHALEDIAIMRTFPNMHVIVPADGLETILAIRAVAALPGPVYVRLGRKESAQIYDAPYDFQIGQASLLRAGSDVTIISCGVQPTAVALEAWHELQTLNISARVINLHTIKPLDVNAIVTAAEETHGIITVEEHTPFGGLGGAVAEVVCEYAPCRVLRLAVPQQMRDVVGSHQFLLEAAGITPETIVTAVFNLVG